MSVFSIMRKDLITLTRDRSALVFLFALPIVFIAIFGSISSNGRGSPPIKILVSNQDSGKHGAELIESMKEVGLQPEISDVNTGGLDAVRAKIEKGSAAIGVVIPADYSDKVEASVKSMISGAADIPPADLNILLDPAQAQVGEIAQGALRGAVLKASGPLFQAAQLEQIQPEYRDQAAKQMAGSKNRQTVKLNVSKVGAKTVLSTGDAIIPGFAVYFVFFMANSVAATFLLERSEGTLRRMLNAPVSRNQIMLGKMLSRGIVGVAQTIMLFGIGKFAMHLTLNFSQLPGVTLVALLTIFAATGLGLLIATFGKTMDQIQGMTTLTLLSMGFLSGTLIPRQFMPEALQKLSYITPHAWALNAYQDIMLRHLPITATWLNIVVLAGFGLAFYLIALARFRFEI